eukprot:13898392-Alexandrium_andersonii.AAC.1
MELATGRARLESRMATASATATAMTPQAPAATSCVAKVIAGVGGVGDDCAAYAKASCRGWNIVE